MLKGLGFGFEVFFLSMHLSLLGISVQWRVTYRTPCVLASKYIFFLCKITYLAATHAVKAIQQHDGVQEFRFQGAGTGGCRGGLCEEWLELPHARHRQFQSLQGTAQPSSQDSGAAGKVLKREKHCLASEEFGNCHFPSPLHHSGLGGEPGVREWTRTWKGEERRWFNFCLCFPLPKSIWYFKAPSLLHLVISHQNVRLHVHLVLKCSYKQTSYG